MCQWTGGTVGARVGIKSPHHQAFSDPLTERGFCGITSCMRTLNEAFQEVGIPEGVACKKELIKLLRLLGMKRYANFLQPYNRKLCMYDLDDDLEAILYVLWHYHLKHKKNKERVKLLVQWRKLLRKLT